MRTYNTLVKASLIIIKNEIFIYDKAVSEPVSPHIYIHMHIIGVIRALRLSIRLINFKVTMYVLQGVISYILHTYLCRERSLLTSGGVELMARVINSTAKINTCSIPNTKPTAYLYTYIYIYISNHRDNVL